MESFAAIVLAGGASSRMGRPKALLPFGDETLIERVVGRLRKVAGEVIVVSGRHLRLPPLLGAHVIEDETPPQGPVAGIFHGLEAARFDLGFVCGCDHPFLQTEIVKLVVDRAATSDGAVATSGGVPQPLVAAYRKRVAAVAASMLAAGEHRASVLIERSGAVVIPEEDVRLADSSGHSFLDVDTPEAYRHALEIFSARASS